MRPTATGRDALTLDQWGPTKRMILNTLHFKIKSLKFVTVLHGYDAFLCNFNLRLCFSV